MLSWAIFLISSISSVHAFSCFLHPSVQQYNHPKRIHISKTKTILRSPTFSRHLLYSSTATKSNEESPLDDEKLLRTVSKSQLQDVCTQFNISKKGTKEELLLRLRSYGDEQANIEKERRQRQVQRIEQGVDDTQGNGKARHKVVGMSDDITDNDDDVLDGAFYFSLPGDDNPQNITTSSVKVTTTKIMNPQNSPFNTITAPLPPPGSKPNEEGERTVAIYSTKDQNDLTAMTNQNSASDDAAMLGGYSRTDSMGKGPENTLAGGPFGDQSGSQRKKASDKEFDAACDIISDLVLSLLQMTGAPAFQDEFNEGVVPLEELDSEFSSKSKSKSSDENTVSGGNDYNTDFGFIGFDPSRVPTALITQSSKSLRVRNGEALRQALTNFEMQAIGIDGRSGDDKNKGGGHYLEVQKVGTFLEGFRKAEVRRIARETSTMLLDKLVTEGVKSLDQMLMTMTKGSDDSSDAGELNDSLINYLEDSVRQQERKVEQMFGSQGVKDSKANTLSGVEFEDLGDGLSDSFWNITKNEGGETVESLDPNDPAVKEALARELELAKEKINSRSRVMPNHPAQQLLLLLTLLRERVKAEAMFANDEKGQNLRILAYCLHASNHKERESIIVDNIGNSLDKLDSFLELLESSIDYAKSTTHLLQPSKANPLDAKLLNSIQDIVEEVRETQAWKASGISKQQNNDSWQ
mmetsp:Transcript_1508/g.1641  ORF Transcript_1508/g.1641 Transcript_1508/m.1641 type:complete len:693 (+) Transcript_1508:207-2285(+)